jgi:type IV pilus assembly protein PilB
MALCCQAVSLSRANSTLTLAMADPTDLYVMDHIKHMTGCRVEAVVAPEASIAEAIEKFYGHTEEVEELDRVIRDLGGAELELTAQEEEVDWRSWSGRPKRRPSSSW